MCDMPQPWNLSDEEIQEQHRLAVENARKNAAIWVGEFSENEDSMLIDTPSRQKKPKHVRWSKVITYHRALGINQSVLKQEKC